MASLDTLATDYRTITEAAGCSTAPSAGKLALTGARRRELPPGPGHERRRGAVRRRRLLRGVPHARRARCSATCGSSPTGDELLLDTERRRAPGAVQHDPALQHRLRRRAAQAHARARAAVADRPGRGRRRRRGGPARDEHAHALSSVPGGRRRRGRSAPTSASTCCATRRTPTRCGPRSRRRARSRWPRPPPSACGSSAGGRATGSTSTTR